MAKRKKKAHHVKHRRMGGMSSGMGEAIKLLAGATVGVLGGRFINNNVTFLPAIAMGGVETVGGALLAAKSKKALLKGIGVGLAANGAIYLAGSKGLNVLPASIGYGPPGPVPFRAVSGYRDVPKIGNFPKPGAIGRNTNLEAARMAHMYAGVYD